jgi:dipeptidase
MSDWKNTWQLTKECGQDQTCKNQLAADRDQYQAELNRCNGMSSGEKATCLDRLNKFTASYEVCGNDKACKEQLIADKKCLPR